jgi:hypothetical protein
MSRIEITQRSIDCWTLNKYNVAAIWNKNRKKPMKILAFRPTIAMTKIMMTIGIVKMRKRSKSKAIKTENHSKYAKNPLRRRLKN